MLILLVFGDPLCQHLNPQISLEENIRYGLRGHLQYTVARGSLRPTSSLLADQMNREQSWQQIVNFPG